jgi:O-antigen ligase
MRTHFEILSVPTRRPLGEVPRRAWVRLAGPAAACAYVLAFALPLRTDYSLVALALCAALTLTSADNATPTRRTNALVFAIVGFCVSSGVSLVLSADPARSFASSVSLLPAILLFLIVGYDFSSPAQVRALFLALSVVALGLAGALVAIGLADPSAPPTAWVARLESPIIVVPNDAVLFAVLVPVFLLPVRRDPRSLGAALGAAAATGALFACLLLQSRTALLTGLVCLLALAVLWRSRILLLAAAAAPVAGWIVDRFLLDARLAAKFASLLDNRLALWLSAWRMFLDAPFAGNGPNTFGLLYLPYLEGLDLRGRLPVDDRVIPWPHNLYLEMLAERGVPGLVALLLVLLAAGWVLWRHRRSRCRDARLIASASLASLAGLCFAGLIELTLLRLWVVVLVFVLCGVANFLARHNDALTPDSA